MPHGSILHSSRQDCKPSKQLGGEVVSQKERRETAGGCGNQPDISDPLAAPKILQHNTQVKGPALLQGSKHRQYSADGDSTHLHEQHMVGDGAGNK